MNSLITSLNAWSAELLPLVVAILWQSTLLALLVALAAWRLARNAPAVRYWLWQIVALKLLLMPFWTIAVPLPQALRIPRPDPTPPADSVPIDVTAFLAAASDAERPLLAERPSLPVASEPAPQLRLGDISWPAWFLLGWAAVVLFQISRIAYQRMRLRRLLRRAAPADAELRARVDRLTPLIGVRRAPSVVLTERECPPFVCGLRRPFLVLPDQSARELTPSQLEHVLLHELAHVRRKDLIWGWIPEIARLVYFFHPVAHWAARQTRLERELACDHLVLAASGAAAGDYAATLLQVVSNTSQPKLIRAGVAPLSRNIQPSATTPSRSRKGECRP